MTRTYQRDAENEGHGGDEGKPLRIPIHPVLFQQRTETVANQKQRETRTDSIVGKETATAVAEMKPSERMSDNMRRLDIVPVLQRVYRWERQNVDVDFSLVEGRRLVREHHQVGVERDRVQNVASDVERDRDNHTPVVLGNSPLHGDERRGEDDDAGEGDDGEDECDTEALEDLGDFHEEIGALDFLLCRTPRDI
ncbi:10415_t:CDS:2, partial [Acaulospora colombiana]